MRNRLRTVFGWLAAVCGLLAQDATAWNAAGHRLSASLAWNAMGAASQQRVVALLRQHPALPLWQQRIERGRSAGAATPAALFAEAATWADELRREAAANRDADAHRDWHYLNWPVGHGAKASRGGRLDQAIAAQAARLAERKLPAGERAEALAWLIHLVADAHQPLHVASWPLDDGSFDDGGLGFPVRDPSRPQRAPSSLHSWWDELPGPSWLRGERLAQRAEILRGTYPAASIVQGDSADWLAESFELASQDLRPDRTPNPTPWPITDRYRARAKAISERRLAEAGVRLGRLLDALLTAEGGGQPGGGAARKR